jgi:hypothetical protein
MNERRLPGSLRSGKHHGPPVVLGRGCVQEQSIVRFLDNASVHFPRELCDCQVLRYSPENRSAVSMDRYGSRLDVRVPADNEHVPRRTWAPDHTRVIEMCEVVREGGVVAENRPVEIDTSKTARIQPPRALTGLFETIAPSRHDSEWRRPPRIWPIPGTSESPAQTVVQGLPERSVPWGVACHRRSARTERG